MTTPGLMGTGEQSAAPTLSIVIVNSDGLRDTLTCIESIYRHPPREPFEIVVVDNCSREPAPPAIAERYPAVRAFMAPARQGFAKNYNQGIRASRGEFVLVLNNDTLVSAGALDAMIDALRANPQYGMVGPMLLGRNGVIQHDCARNLPTPGGYLIAHLLLDSGFPPGRIWQHMLTMRASRRPSGAVPCICGACMLISRADLDAVGLLDEGYDFYYEDIEWCHRFQRRGRAVGYIAEARITHLGDQSLSKVKVWAKRSEYQSALRYFSRYYDLSPGRRDLLWLGTIVNYFLRGLAMVMAEAMLGKPTYAREYLFLWGWLLRRHPGACAGGGAS